MPDFGEESYSLAGIIEHVGAENKNFGGYRSLVNIENK